MKIKKRFYKWRINRLKKKIGQIQDSLAKSEYCKRNHLLDEDELDYWVVCKGPVEIIGNIHENKELLK